MQNQQLVAHLSECQVAPIDEEWTRESSETIYEVMFASSWNCNYYSFVLFDCLPLSNKLNSFENHPSRLMLYIYSLFPILILSITSSSSSICSYLSLFKEKTALFFLLWFFSSFRHFLHFFVILNSQKKLNWLIFLLFFSFESFLSNTRSVVVASCQTLSTYHSSKLMNGLTRSVNATLFQKMTSSFFARRYFEPVSSRPSNLILNVLGQGGSLQRIKRSTR